jgi:hypothetical protein
VNAKSTLEPKTYPFTDWPDIYIQTGVSIVSADPGSNIEVKPADYQAWSDYFAPYVGLQYIGMNAKIAREKSRGKVTLASASPYDSPLIDLNFLSNSYDLKLLIESCRMTWLLMLSNAMKRVNCQPFPPVPGCAHLFALNKRGKYSGVPVDAYLSCMITRVDGISSKDEKNSEKGALRMTI